MNSKEARSKFGKLDENVNYYGKLLFVLTLSVSIMIICLKGFDSNLHWLITMFRYFLILTTFIPISSKVHIDVSKAIFSYLISHDQSIPNTQARNSDIPEELGSISYFLTDKTGTLT
jgi:phospholipid-translocating ATPase